MKKSNFPNKNHPTVKSGTIVYKVLMGGHHLRYPLPYPLPGFFPTTLPEPYPKSKIPTRHSLFVSSCLNALSSPIYPQHGISTRAGYCKPLLNKYIFVRKCALPHAMQYCANNNAILDGCSTVVLYVYGVGWTSDLKRAAENIANIFH